MHYFVYVILCFVGHGLHKFWFKNCNKVSTILFFSIYVFIFNVIMWFCGCFGKGYKNFDLIIRNKVFNTWCHGCDWDCVSPIFFVTKLWDVFPKMPSSELKHFTLAKPNLWMGWRPLCLKTWMLMTLITNKACSNLTMKSIVITSMASPFWHQSFDYNVAFGNNISSTCLQLP